MSQARIILGFFHSFVPCDGVSELEALYQERLKKTLTLVYNHPHIQLVLYYSGPLLNWLEKNHPEYIAVLNELSNQKRVELLSGPYYEPILPLLSISDTLGQIEKLTTSIRKNIRRRSRGCWIPGSFWDQKLVSNLSNSGLNYCFLDESYFSNEGITYTHREFKTEDQGKPISLLPVHKKLSDMILNGKLDAFLNYMKKQTIEGELISLFFPGELAGEPQLNGWLKKLFGHLDPENKGYKTVLPADVLKDESRFTPTVYLRGTTIYQYKDYFQYWYGNDQDQSSVKEQAHFKNYIGTNRTCNYVYGKSTYTSLLINQIRGDRARKKIAREYLWKGQNLFSYWNGEKAYLSSRQALRYLMEAEKMTREKGIFKSSITSLDLNNKGLNDFIFQGNYYNCAIDSRNSSIFQLDYLPDCWNYFYNEMGWPSFEDLFIKDDEDWNDTEKKLLDHLDRNPNVYSGSRDDKQIIFYRDGLVSDSKGKNARLGIQKKYLFKRNWFTISYQFTNKEESSKTFHFASNISFGLPSTEGDSYSIHSHSDKSSNSKLKENTFKKSSGFSLLDKINNTDIQVDLNLPMDIWCLEKSKKGWNNRYNLCLFPHIRFQLFPQETFELNFSFKLSKHR